MTVEDVSRLDFCDLEIAYLFYCWYAKIIGFSVRKSHILRNTCRETLQQTFVCLCAGYRRDKGSTSKIRKRQEKKKKASVVVKQCFVFMCIFVGNDGM